MNLYSASSRLLLRSAQFVSEHLTIDRIQQWINNKYQPISHWKLPRVIRLSVQQSAASL